jgi:hypothetical protein
VPDLGQQRAGLVGSSELDEVHRGVEGDAEGQARLMSDVGAGAGFFERSKSGLEPAHLLEGGCFLEEDAALRLGRCAGEGPLEPLDGIWKVALIPEE